jgi:uncharacterized membrane protein YgcG
LASPIEIVLRSRNRLARLAVLRALLHAVLPMAVTLAIALDLDLLNALAFDHFGYLMDAASARLFQRSLLVLSLVQLGAVSLFAWRAWSQASDFIRTAEAIDRCVGGRQEIVTLATLSDPAHPEAANVRSPLFPILWERVTAYLEAFDPRSAFTPELRVPLIRSFILAALAVIFVSTAAFALMTWPTPAQSVIHRLQLLATTIDTSAPTSAQRQLAAAARDVAKDLINPKLPPQEKLAELRSLEQELQKSQKQHQTANSGKGNSSAGGNGNGTGGGQGAGHSSGSGNGSGISKTGSGAGSDGKANQQMVELHNDIAKAQIKLEQEAASDNKSKTARNDRSDGTGGARKPGTNPNQPGGQNSSNRSGQVPEPQALASGKMPSGQSPSARRSDRGSMGDTHLGEFPKPGNYQRFYKLGERGPAINIRDARYVTFQLPTEIESAGAGVIVPDNTRSQAATPYTNSPLKPERLPVSPDEQQLVPPRYRELLR